VINIKNTANAIGCLRSTAAAVAAAAGFLAHVIIKVIYLLISLMAIVTTIITRTARERTLNSLARHISFGDIISLFITPKKGESVLPMDRPVPE
jgi:hypothetical protein